MKPILKNKLLKRLKIIEGQIRGLQGMLHDDKYCVDVITQASAVKKAVSSFEDAVLENHLATHVVEQIKFGQHSKAVTEVMKVYKLSRKDG
jgi:CsoR family transcriptional regulator, copper-sensing transcriptional repressor